MGSIRHERRLLKAIRFSKAAAVAREAEKDWGPLRSAAALRTYSLLMCFFGNGNELLGA